MSIAAIKKLIPAGWPALSLSLMLLVIVALIYVTGDRGLSRTMTDVLIKIVLVVGIYIFVGNSGVLSFGHIAFSGIAGYAAAWQTCCAASKSIFMPGLPNFLLETTVPNFPSAITASLLAASVAFIIGMPLMRLNGLAASIGTFCFLAILHVVYANWRTVTGGTGSIVGVPLYVTPWVALGWSILTIWVAFLYQQSRYGLLLRCTREDEVAARASGIDVIRQRLIAFVLSAFFAGLGGVLYAHFLGVVSVETYYLDLTFITLAMLVVGGMGTLSGAVVGVVVLSALIEILREFEGGIEIWGASLSLPRGTQEIVLGVVMLLILIFRPSGITGNKEFLWPSRKIPRGGLDNEPGISTLQKSPPVR